ncbi:hypothetical protein BCON_0105g00180 [Botryotinia convoluta]|uniref:Dickkopf N-terminal cysteine-rich domain-containing protein n=1 Tax=Botryotinia convoluta TaxID=54673 RepID=A0A4Z1HZ72_9HELO|nr:hypothetical protein BCON_0105g00180 [Botryotinia convoluta]
MRTSNVILAILSLSSTISALAAPRSAALDKGLNGFEKDCQCSAIGSVCHKASHINCCNGFSCEMMDNPNGDYGICRASNDRKKDEKCMCSMSDDVCHPKSDINCCFGLFCDMTNNPNSDYGKFKPSHESKNPFKKIEDVEKCLESGCAPPCCSRAKCNKVGRSNSQMFMCEKESDDDDKKQCLVPGAHHCNMSGMECCPGSSCQNVRGESFMCAKDSDDDDDDDRCVITTDKIPSVHLLHAVRISNALHKSPLGAHLLDVHVKKINIIAAAEVKVAQEEEHSRLYALKGMFHGFVEKIEKKYCLPQGGG